MNTVEEIKKAISSLDKDGLRQLEAWWHPSYDEWDLQISEDSRAGKLDELTEQVL